MECFPHHNSVMHFRLEAWSDRQIHPYLAAPDHLELHRHSSGRIKRPRPTAPLDCQSFADHKSEDRLQLVPDVEQDVHRRSCSALDARYNAPLCTCPGSIRIEQLEATCDGFPVGSASSRLTPTCKRSTCMTGQRSMQSPILNGS